MGVKTYKTSDKMWTDEANCSIPISRITKSEKLKERQSLKLLKGAKSLHEKLTSYKEEVIHICNDVYEQFMLEQNNQGKEAKGNFTWYNFNRSIKIVVSINERIEFDDLTITACRDKLNEFLDNNIETKDQFIKDMVLDAFETSRGKLDTKKVMSLLKHRSRIKAPLFQEAMSLLEKSIRRTDSKTYFQIWEKDHNGEYQSVDLNFSSIKI